MLGSRRGRPSLIGRAAGTAARTAIITKTATTVAGNATQKQAAQAPHAFAGAEAGAVEAPAAQADTAAGGMLARLHMLAELHDGGMLGDADFIAKVKEELSA